MSKKDEEKSLAALLGKAIAGILVLFLQSWLGLCVLRDIGVNVNVTWGTVLEGFVLLWIAKSVFSSK